METPLVKYPVGIQSFPELRKGGYLYVDKTKFIHRLVSTGKYYFLSRPHRFGKSLFLSTIKAYFEGKRELFKGLALDSLTDEWDEYPVIGLSLAKYDPEKENLVSIIEQQMAEMERRYGRRSDTMDLASRFSELILSAHEKFNKNVVILIDEYDAPMVAHLENKDKVEGIRSMLKSIYTNLKDNDDYIKFGMLTGVSRFGRMTIFSGINNLNDISLLKQYSEICGISEKEFETFFNVGVQNFADEEGLGYDEMFRRLKDNYDGYHFTENSADIYNPFSLLLALNNQKIMSYWYSIGSPTFLIKLLHRHKGMLSRLLNEKVREAVISDIYSFPSSPLALLFQTGYLTIKAFDPRKNAYTLGIPNKEVENGLFTELLSVNLGKDQFEVEGCMWDIRDAFEEGDPEKGLKITKSLLASVPGNVTQNMPEIYYENNLYLLFKLVGLDARAEWWSSDGRIDMLLMTPACIYVMELKLDGTPQEALAQIDSKNYALQFEHDGRKVFKIGINYSKETRNMDDWIIREMK